VFFCRVLSSQIATIGGELGWNTAVFRDEGLLSINRLSLHIEAKGYSEAKAIR